MIPFRGRRAEPQSGDPNNCVDEGGLGPEYVYLLGLYLGDGMLSKQHHDVWRLRIFQTSRYFDLIERCKRSIFAVAGREAGQFQRDGCTEVLLIQF